jgi:transcriptional regulator
MYTPAYATNNDVASIKKFIKHNSFGILVSQSTQKIMATHIPFQLSQEESKLTTHLSRANPQTKHFISGTEVLAIFTGPHAYISSSWYDHENVPTWNYIAAHVYGKLQILEGERVNQSLDHFMRAYENRSLESMSSEYVKTQIKGLVAIQIEITTIEATYKLSQNRDQKNHANIIHQLEDQKNEGTQRVADEMKKRSFENPAEGK